MGQKPSSPLATCLNNVCDGRSSCVGYPNDPLFQINWVKPYNLDIAVEPIAVTRPKTKEDVAGFVKCAADNDVKVQAKSGGHSYANFGLGGTDGALVIDLVNFQSFSMDTDTWQATIGAGHRLHDVTEKLHDNGKRAMAHGTCPGVGIGGHATIGGLGPSSRMWGSCLDHVVEVEVVTADGKIQRASETQNSDLFFALKGAGAGFGVITEFVMRTHPEPGDIVQYSYSITFAKHRDLAPVFKQWQDLISDPNLDRRFGSEFVMQELGVAITATFYGTEDEFKATGIPDKIPKGKVSVVVNDWLGDVAQKAQDAALWLSEVQSPFTAKSLAFTRDDLLTDDGIRDLMDYIDEVDRGTLIWFLIFDVTGGAINDVPMNATAYRHRDKIMFCQGYGVGIPTLSTKTKEFMAGVAESIRKASPNELSTYAGYVDPTLENAQEKYWGSNLPTLQRIKAAWDPKDLFSNPQSVRPDANAKDAEPRASDPSSNDSSSSDPRGGDS
ncbi:FAD binding domain-containing protein [Colletotrichum tofieldiae]|uniref:FAD binding domain-containing protein n=1 Tax=Colletotrichum tofieldiae TaxID=708197 RepID=A0A166PCQ5_9PEZI|nr:FAD binding domain-containing protein [Colletotrichum tofieldiae]GKT64233.1 FAD binding domain-containing protein [Colletotrichum tofieldiae]GKT74182.1 FAD binding domain-containing protein [Colletotrichum tofieldiae]GKT97094.1 FAD binding domain-containing protein [Colletotrichum tofieldiae]